MQLMRVGLPVHSVLPWLEFVGYHLKGYLLHLVGNRADPEVNRGPGVH